ncbi:efflux RND transporter periplasmic adaptor subunit [bacterium]|nr:efflux RND transporter periplasmic adaptor subunit [bacterium]
MKFNFKFAIIMFLVITLTLVSSVSCKRKPKLEKGEELSQAVIITKPQTKKFAETFDSSSTTTAFKVATITPKVSANIVKFLVQEGDKVKEGQALAQLDKTDYMVGKKAAEAQVSAAEAGVMQAEAAFEKMSNDYERYKKLKKQGSISESDYESVESGYKQTEAGLAAAKAQVEMAKSSLNNYNNQLAYTTIKAPFEGYISMKRGEIGEMASPAMPMFEIVQTDQLKVDIYISELEIYGITKDSTAEITFDAYPDRKETAKVNYINSKVDSATSSVKVEFVFDNKQHTYKPGMTVRAKITMPEREHLVVPRNSIFTRDNEVGTVYYKTDDNKVYSKNVTMGGSVEGFSIIRNGLDGNEEIVVGGGRQLEEGQTVTVIETRN